MATAAMGRAGLSCMQRKRQCKIWRLVSNKKTYCKENFKKNYRCCDFNLSVLITLSKKTGMISLLTM